VNAVRREAIAILKLGGPLIAAQLAQISINFVDTVMAGNLSADALAAVAVGTNAVFFVTAVCLGLLMAVSPSVAQLFGAGRYPEIGKCVRQGLWLSLATGVLGMLALRAIEPMLSWIGVVPEILPTTIGFLRAFAWGIPAFCIFQVLRSFNEAISMTRPIFIGSVLGLLGCIAGDYILMYGKFGMPRMGAVGCGVASAIVLWFMALFLGAYTYLKPEYSKYHVFEVFEWPQFAEINALLKLGTPIAVSLFMEVSLFAGVALLMGSLGTVAAAGHQIALNVASITFMVPLGLAMAITVRVGQAIGRGEPLAARFAGRVGVSMAALFMSCSALVLWVFPGFIAGIYTNDPNVKNMAATLLLMAAIFQIFDGLQVSGSGALRGLKDTKVPMLITTLAYWGIGMPFGYFLAITRGGGPAGFWIGFICGLVVSGILLNIRFQLSTRRLIDTSLARQGGALDIPAS
jgi:MATE family multidrug resistance protein